MESASVSLFRSRGSGPGSRYRLPCWLRRALLICAAILLAACSEKTPLQASLNDADANEIVSVLNRHGIKAQKHITKTGVTLIVNADDLSRATDAMHAAGLPRRARDSLGQVFKKEGMISTPLEERIRYIHGLSQELEYTLQQFDNVISARVHVVLPERVAPGEPIQPSSAAVFIKYKPPLDEDVAVPRVRNLVASSIPGLSGADGHGKVSVVLVPSETVAPVMEWSEVGPFIVHAKNAFLLRLTLGFLVLAAVAASVYAVTAGRNTSAKAWLRAHFGKAREFRGADDEHRS